MKQQLLAVLLLLVGVVQSVRTQEPYAALSSDNTTLTFYYDTKKEARGGMSIGPFVYPANYSSWVNQGENITSVVFDDSFAACSSITSTSYWFSGCVNLVSITGMENLNTANVTSMSYMFDGCSSLTSLDLSTLNTASVTSMYCMFYGCSGLTSLNLSNFNTANVTNMGWMFNNCYSLTSLDLSNFNTANVTDMKQMFAGCSGLTSLNLSNINTANVTDMFGMFQGCSGLTSIDLSNFNTTQVKNMGYMFYNCSGLNTIYCDDTWTCYHSNGMFSGCTSLAGAITYDETKTDVAYANPDTGYFTRKGETTITTLKVADGQMSTPVYSLSGQRLSKPQKGINIIGGRKVVVK